MEGYGEGMTEEERERAMDVAEARELLRKVDFALQVKQFMDGDVCRRMVNDAGAELDELKKAILDVDIDTEEGRVENRRMRQRAAVLTTWQAFFQEYIAEGESAAAQYQQKENPVTLEDNEGSA